jgi:anti-sigma regulatory factor (Ser/Thr protein kinase)
MTRQRSLAVARSVPAIAENVAALRQAVTELAARAGATERTQSDIALAVGEACGNVVHHAYPPGETGPLVVEAQAGAEEVLVVVTDMGRGCVPRPDSGGLGLGLPLMTSLARQVTITDGEGGCGTQVRMTFPV